MFFKSSTAFTLLMVCLLVSMACKTSVSMETQPEIQAFDVDPLLKEIYGRLGGVDTLGPAISSPFSYGQLKYQFTVGALLVMKPDLANANSAALDAVGLDLGILESTVPPPEGPSLLYVDGHVIDPSFVPLYQKLGGGDVTGKPITEARYNPQKKRIEQYFENLGFYRLENDPEGRVYLLAYGSWKCGRDCPRASLENEDAVIVPPVQIAPELRVAVERLGLGLTGFALEPPAIGSDGALEQVFENVILAIPVGGESRVILRPVPSLVGIESEPPVSPRDNPSLYFYPLADETGHNVYKSFLDYLAAHGGLDAAGPPITELTQTDRGTLRQCFTNLCLEDHPTEMGMLRICPAPLGYEYWQVHQAGQRENSEPSTVQTPTTEEPDQISSPTTSPEILSTEVGDGILLHVWKKYPVLKPDQRQEIGAIVLNGSLPVPDLAVELYLNLPDGQQVRIQMPPTGSDGQSFYQLESLDSPPGSPIKYKICVYMQAGDPTCVEDSFLIWE
jgi:hypothetical protein